MYSQEGGLKLLKVTRHSKKVARQQTNQSLWPTCQFKK